MFDSQNILALIPARGGSKRVPRKNIMPLLGKPLIAYTIESAIACKSIDKIIVSTEDEEIAGIARNSGAEVPFVRPVELATDTANDQDMIRHALDALESGQGYKPDIVLLLRPTSPIRSPGLIESVLSRMQEMGADVVRTVTRVEGVHHPYWMYKVSDEGWAEPLLAGVDIGKYYQSQLLPPVYRLNGVVDAMRASVAFDEKYLTDKKMAFIEVSGHESIDIDTELDFKLCEMLLSDTRIIPGT